MTVALIDYGSGNLRSAGRAIQRAAHEAAYTQAIRVTSSAEEVLRAERVVLPGVGAFADCFHRLQNLPGMLEALQEAVCKRGRPFLGICVGMQLLAITGREHGCHRGLGWIAGEVVLLKPASSLRVPHVGWNELQLPSSTHPVFAGLRDRHAYFVHSYHFVPHSQSSLLATADYGQVIAAAVGRDNIVGTQFHPEKSQAVGLRVLANFLLWRP